MRLLRRSYTDATKEAPGMIDGIVRRVNYLAQATIPTSFDGLLAGQGLAHVSSMNIDDRNGPAVLLPMLVSSLVCSLLVDVATIISMVVVWGRGMQLYFMATMSPIPLALLGIDETRQMGVGFLRYYAALVLGYAALSFVVKLFPPCCRCPSPRAS